MYIYFLFYIYLYSSLHHKILRSKAMLTNFMQEQVAEED